MWKQLSLGLHLDQQIKCTQMYLKARRPFVVQDISYLPSQTVQTLEQGVCVQTACWRASGAAAAKPRPGIVQGKSLLELAKIVPGNITGVNDGAPVPGNLPKHTPLHWDRCRPCHFSLRGLFCSPAVPNQPSFDFHSVNSVPSVAKIVPRGVWKSLIPKWVSGCVRRNAAGAIC